MLLLLFGLTRLLLSIQCLHVRKAAPVNSDGASILYEISIPFMNRAPRWWSAPFMKWAAHSWTGCLVHEVDHFTNGPERKDRLSVDYERLSVDVTARQLKAAHSRAKCCVQRLKCPPTCRPTRARWTRRSPYHKGQYRQPWDRHPTDVGNFPQVRLCVPR